MLAWRVEELSILYRNVEEFEKTSVERFDEHFGSGQFALKRHLLDHRRKTCK